MFGGRPIQQTTNRVRVLIPDAGNVLALPVVRALARLPSVDIWLLVDEKAAPGWQTMHKRGLFYRRRASLIEDTLVACAACEADVVFPVSEPGIREISAHRAAFASKVRLPLLPTPETLDLASDKVALAEFAQQHRIPIPATVIFDAARGPAIPAFGLRFPLLAKPASGMGGVGIRYLRDCAALAAFFHEHTHDGRWVLQEFIAGHDGGCSVLCRDGVILAHTVQRAVLRPTPNGPVGDGIELRHDPKVLALITPLMAALKFDGVAHCDLRFDALTGEIRLLEINPRFWGSLLGSVRAGVNFAALALGTAFDEMPAAPSYAPRRYYPATLALQIGSSSPRQALRLPAMLRDSDVLFRLRDPLADLARLLSRESFNWVPRGDQLAPTTATVATANAR